MNFTIYVKPSCTYCERAKQILTKNNLDFIYIDLSLDEKKLEEFRSKGFRTVPIIYCDNDLVGGFDELQDYLLDILE